jgi:cytoskeletal protein CcmA (bactofilin family)
MKPAEDSTVIGKSVSIRGDITGSEDLYLDGEIQGTVTLPGNRLTIGPNAHVLADVEVRDIIVNGHIEGNIHASGRVDLRQTAIVHGDIYTSRLSIEEKASIQGRVDVGATGPTITIPRQTVAAAPATVHDPPAPLFAEQKR